MVSTTTDRKKVVVKNLPPTLPEESLRTAIEEVCSGKYSSLRFVPGKISVKGQRPSRAYLYMNDSLLVYDFRAAFDGHSFVNERGVQFRCSVEFAPYQKAPKVITKKDPREGTLDKDADYQEFVAELEKDPYSIPGTKKQEDGEEAAEGESQPTNAGGKRVSALMQYLEQKWTGKLEGSSDPRKASRQRGRGGKKEREENLGWEGIAPPPGFAPLGAPPTILVNPERNAGARQPKGPEPAADGAAPSKKTSGRASKGGDGKDKTSPPSSKQEGRSKRAKDKGASEASGTQKGDGWGEVPASQDNGDNDVWGEATQPAEGGKGRRGRGSAKPPKGEWEGKQREQGEGGKGRRGRKEPDQASVAASLPALQKVGGEWRPVPTQLLKKDAGEGPQDGGEGEESQKPRGERRQKGGRSEEGASGDAARKAQGKAVRAGFQVYTPRVRSSSPAE